MVGMSECAPAHVAHRGLFTEPIPGARLQEDLRAVKLSVVPLVITSAIFAISSDYTEKMFNRVGCRTRFSSVDWI